MTLRSETLRFVAPGEQVVPGLVTTRSGVLEDADAIERRIEAAAAFVPIEQLCLSPQCGFSSTLRSDTLTVDEWAELDLIVEVAAEVRG